MTLGNDTRPLEQLWGCGVPGSFKGRRRKYLGLHRQNPAVGDVGDRGWQGHQTGPRCLEHRLPGAPHGFRGPPSPAPPRTPAPPAGPPPALRRARPRGGVGGGAAPARSSPRALHPLPPALHPPANKHSTPLCTCHPLPQTLHPSLRTFHPPRASLRAPSIPARSPSLRSLHPSAHLSPHSSISPRVPPSLRASLCAPRAGRAAPARGWRSGRASSAAWWKVGPAGAAAARALQGLFRSTRSEPGSGRAPGCGGGGSGALAQNPISARGLDQHLWDAASSPQSPTEPKSPQGRSAQPPELYMGFLAALGSGAASRCVPPAHPAHGAAVQDPCPELARESSVLLPPHIPSSFWS